VTPFATPGTSGVTNTGGGGGGAGNSVVGSSGGSGVVILKYSDNITLINPTGGLTFTTDSISAAGEKITTFTAGTGNIQFV
jgi:hypothetical protein